MDEPRNLKFRREVRYQKIFDACLGIFQNLDQRPVLLKYGYNFGMDEPIYLKFCRESKHQKIFHTCLRAFQNLDQGLDGALKTVSKIWLELWTG